MSGGTFLSTSPLATDLFSRAMVDMYDETQVIGAPTAFQAFFGRPETGAKTLFSPNSSVVDIDIIRGNERLAALVLRGTNSREIARHQNTKAEKYTSISRRYPLIEEEGDISADQLEFRAAGENPFESRDRLTRMRGLALRHIHEHIRRITRSFEYLSSLSVLTGKMPAIALTSNPNLIYDFLRKSTHIFTPAAPWSTTSTLILGDLDKACDLIRADAHMAPDMAVFGPAAMKSFLVNTEVLAKADNRRFELIEVNRDMPVPAKFDRFIAGGFTPRGRLRTPGGYELWLFTYIEVFTNPVSGDPTPYIPSDTALIASSMARCDRYFGPPEVLPNIPMRDQLYSQLFGFMPGAVPAPPNIKDMNRAINPAMFYHDAYTSADWKTVSVRTQAAPIFATTATDGFVTINEVNTTP